MSENIINKVLEKRGWILADGGIGTQLFDMGLQTLMAQRIVMTNPKGNLRESTKNN